MKEGGYEIVYEARGMTYWWMVVPVALTSPKVKVIHTISLLLAISYLYIEYLKRESVCE